MSKTKIFRIVWFSLAAIFLIWNWLQFQSHDLPPRTLKSDDKVTVKQTDDQVVFIPALASKNETIIFFPGGLADPDAYAPLCKQIAENGYTCHLIKMSFRLPQRDYKKISTLFNFDSGRYIIGGHSQGAKMAAQYVYENPTQLQGLLLMGTSHPRDISLSDLAIPAIKLYGENDGLASVAEVLENKNMLPKNAELVLIKGGNHSQFGYLGNLLGDDKATISLEDQQRQVLENLLKFFEAVDVK